MEGEAPRDTNRSLNFHKMTEVLSRDLMIAMLRKGQSGSQILDILNAITPETVEVIQAQEVEAI